MGAEEAYVSADQVVLDPTILEKSAIERMPDPTGWRMLVLPWAGVAKTKGGIHLTKSTVDREALATVVAYVVKMGPLCYNDTEKYGDTPWCQEKQWVIFARYAGSRFRIDGGECRILNDDEILATIDDPEDILSL